MIKRYLKVLDIIIEKSITKSTDILITGNKAEKTKKIEDAIKKNIKIMKLNEFLEEYNINQKH